MASSETGVANLRNASFRQHSAPQSGRLVWPDVDTRYGLQRFAKARMDYELSLMPFDAERVLLYIRGRIVTYHAKKSNVVQDIERLVYTECIGVLRVPRTESRADYVEFPPQRIARH